MSAKTSNKEKILSIAAGGVVLALAFVLSKITIFEMPMGGSITPASILPIVVYGMAFGPVWSFVVAIVYAQFDRAIKHTIFRGDGQTVDVNTHLVGDNL